MDLLGETDSPRPNGFGLTRQNGSGTIFEAIYLTQITGKKQTENVFSFIEIRNKFINKHIKNKFRMICIFVF